MKRLIALIKKLYFDKRIRFLFVGGLNTIVGYGFFALFTYLGLHYAWAQVFSTVIGVIHSYFWNKFFTFRQKKRSLSEIVRFVSVYLVSFLLNLGINYVLIDKNDVNQYIAGAVSLIVVTLLSFIGHNFFSFRQARAQKNDECAQQLKECEDKENESTSE